MLNKVSQRIMERVLELSQNNLDENKVPIAAVIFDPQAKKIISEAKNTDDPLGHAEMHAIRKATKKLKNPVNLDQIKENNKLKNIALIKQSRLSVMPLNKIEWDTIIKMSR